MVQADLGQDRLHGERVESSDGGEVDAGDPVEVSSQVEGGLVTLGLLVSCLVGPERCLTGIDSRVETAEALVDLLVAVGDHLAIRVVEREALVQSEEMLGTVITLEGLGDPFGSALDAVILHRGQDHGVSLAGEDGADDVRRPLTPVMSLITLWSWTFIWVRAFCMRCT